MAKTEPKSYVVMAKSSKEFVYELSPEEERNRFVVRDGDTNCVRLYDHGDGTSQYFSNIAWARLEAMKRCLGPSLPRGYEEYEEEGASFHLKFARNYTQADKERFPVQKETFISGDSVKEEGEGMEPFEYFQCHWVFENEIFSKDLSKVLEKFEEEDVACLTDSEAYGTLGYMTKTLLNGRKRRMKYSCQYSIYRHRNFGGDK